MNQLSIYLIVECQNVQRLVNTPSRTISLDIKTNYSENILCYTKPSLWSKGKYLKIIPIKNSTAIVDLICILLVFWFFFLVLSNDSFLDNHFRFLAKYLKSCWINLSTTGLWSFGKTEQSSAEMLLQWFSTLLEISCFQKFKNIDIKFSAHEVFLE